MWLRDKTIAIDLETGVCLWFDVEYVNTKPEKTRRVVRHISERAILRNPVRACCEAEIIAWVKEYLGDGQLELQPKEHKP